MIETATVTIDFDHLGKFQNYACIQEFDKGKTYMLIIADILHLIAVPPYQNTDLWTCPQNWMTVHE